MVRSYTSYLRTYTISSIISYYGYGDSQILRITRFECDFDCWFLFAHVSQQFLNRSQHKRLNVFGREIGFFQLKNKSLAHRPFHCYYWLIVNVIRQFSHYTQYGISRLTGFFRVLIAWGDDQPRYVPETTDGGYTKNKTIIHATRPHGQGHTRRVVTGLEFPSENCLNL